MIEQVITDAQRDTAYAIAIALDQCAIAEQHAMNLPYSQLDDSPEFKGNVALVAKMEAEQNIKYDFDKTESCLNIEGTDSDNKFLDWAELAYVKRDLIEDFCKLFQLGKLLELRFDWGDETPPFTDDDDEYISYGIVVVFKADNVPDTFKEDYGALLLTMHFKDENKCINLCLKYDESEDTFYLWCPQANGICLGG